MVSPGAAYLLAATRALPSRMGRGQRFFNLRSEIAMEYTTFVLPSGGLLYVQSSQKPSQAVRGTVQAGAAEERMREAWGEGMKLVAEVGAGLINSLQTALTGVDEVTAEFGVNISGKTSIVLVEGAAAANLKIVVKWKAPKTPKTS